MTTVELYEQRIGPGGQTTPLATDLPVFWSAVTVRTFLVSVGTTVRAAETAQPAERTAVLQRLVDRTLRDDGLDWDALEQARQAWE